MAVLNNFHLKRSGHVHVIVDQFWFFYYEMETTTEIAAIHGSPWTYDTYVPLFFAGHGIPSQRIARPVTPYDIAATIATHPTISLQPSRPALKLNRLRVQWASLWTKC
ncbi:MAG: hypothetical protein JRJ51_22970 [Deltaproteobacteria bacterium]|nr:hypothetical protein [Deltaproteobacteria bacterium]